MTIHEVLKVCRDNGVSVDGLDQLPKLANAVIHSAVHQDESGRNAYFVCRFCRASQMINYSEVTTRWNETTDEDEDFVDPMDEQEARLEHRYDCPVLIARRILDIYK